MEVLARAGAEPPQAGAPASPSLAPPEAPGSADLAKFFEALGDLGLSLDDL
jgi:hypothetical protein